MYEKKRLATGDAFRWVVTSEAAEAEAKQHYRSEIQANLNQLHALLPRYWSRVDPARYACDRDELLALTAACHYHMLTLAALEALLVEVKKHRQVFAEVLSLEPASQPRPEW